MKYFFDTEFIEDGKTIELISIGVVAEDGRTYYAESDECDYKRFSPWLMENVYPHLSRNDFKSRKEIADGLVAFMDDDPEIWAYFADYDWVVLCQLFGTMMDLPEHFPRYCRDVKQLSDSLGNPKLPKQETHEHNALADAIWCRDAWYYLKTVQKVSER